MVFWSTEPVMVLYRTFQTAGALNVVSSQVLVIPPS